MENNRRGFEEFYSNNAGRYAEVTHEFIQSVYSNVSHAGLTGDLAIMDRLKELTFSGAKGLDAGCGSGARDVFYYWADGYDVVGIDAVAENIRVARDPHPASNPLAPLKVSSFNLSIMAKSPVRPAWDTLE
jgi:2-polyprenyl-3-methyl-5-hydroxy-6-metoxy-1,4-benzoquinol methylase